MAASSTARRFEIADLGAIIAGVSSLGAALYGAPITAENAQAAPIGFLWLTFLLAGALAVGAVFLAQRTRGASRVMLAVAGLLVLGATFFQGGAWPLIRIVQIVLGLVMLAASTSIGRMPVETR